jgi:hypothetical protein
VPAPSRSDAGLVSQGAAALRIEPLPDGEYRARLAAVSAAESATFAAAWNAWVSPGEMLYTGSPEGAGILVAQRGGDPFDVTTQIRTLWG